MISKTSIGGGGITKTGQQTTANLISSTNKNFVTDAQLTVIGNTSGTNTGDSDKGLFYFGNTNFNPSNGNTYYWGNFWTAAPTTSQGQRRIYFPTAVTIDAITLSVYCVAGATGGQTATFYVRYDATTDTTIGTSDLSTSAFNLIQGTSLGISIAGGGTHWIEIKMVCPTWSGAPTTVFCTGTMQFRF